MKRSILVAMAIFMATAAHAQTYKDVWNDVRKPWRSDYEMDSDMQADSSECERVAGEQRGFPTARFRRCMLRHHWIFSHLEQLPTEEDHDVIPEDTVIPPPPVPPVIDMTPPPQVDIPPPPFN